MKVKAHHRVINGKKVKVKAHTRAGKHSKGKLHKRKAPKHMTKKVRKMFSKGMKSMHRKRKKM